MALSLAAQVSRRVAFSIRNDVNQYARDILHRNIVIFEERTGKQTKGMHGTLPPDNLTEEESQIFNDILSSFLDESWSVEDYKDFARNEKIKQKDYEQLEEERKLQERIAADEKLHDEIYSEVIEEIMTTAKDSRWKAEKVYQAMLDSLKAIDEKKLADTQDDYINDVLDRMRSGLY